MIVRVVIAFGFASITLARADSVADLPGSGLSGDRYVTLWTKSPFSIATPDAPATSADYSLVGMAQFDGVTYVSLIDKQSQEHFVLTSGKTIRNLTLVSVAHGGDGASAIIQHNGETLTLRQEQAPSPPPGSAPILPPAVPAGMPNVPLSSVGGVIAPAYISPPRVRIHRNPIMVPPRPQVQSQPRVPPQSSPQPLSRPQSPPPTGR